MKQLVFSLIAILLLQVSCQQTEPVLTIGLVADPQYADKPPSGTRYYRESTWKLKEAMEMFNDNRVDFVQNLGDIIDGDWRSFDSILPVYRFLHPGIENFHLLGNHDFAVDSSHLADLLERLSMPDYYYSYVKKGWRFIVLDATDVAYFSNALHGYPVDLVDAFYAATEGNPNHFSWNGAIGEKQQKWLKQELDSAAMLGQRVIVFSHMPVRPLGLGENMWNDYQVIDMLENHPQVAAFINGHNHAGNYAMGKGIHYVTIHGMVEEMISSYGILEIFEDHMLLKGFGNQETISLNQLQ